MKFKLDENLPTELLGDLHALGHEAETVLDERLVGAPDSVILERTRSEGSVLLTMDKGIGDIRAYPPNDYAGIVLFRPPTAGRSATLGFIRRHLPALMHTSVAGHLLVVTERSIRVR